MVIWDVEDYYCEGARWWDFARPIVELFSKEVVSLV